VRHGVALRQLADRPMLDVPGIGERGARSLSRTDACRGDRAAVEELYSLVQQVLRESASRAFIQRPGADRRLGRHARHVELGEEIFHMPVRIGVPALRRRPGGRRARAALCDGGGLLLEGAAKLHHGKLSRQSGSMGAVLGRMREWFQRNF